jgi:hypothetical protein
LTHTGGGRKVEKNGVRLTLFSAPLESSRSSEVKGLTDEEQRELFGRHVIMKLKADSAAELTRINESEIIPLLLRQKGFRDKTTFIAPERSKAISNSFWDTKEDEEAFAGTGYLQVLQALSDELEETPTVEKFEFAPSTFPSAITPRIQELKIY